MFCMANVLFFLYVKNEIKMYLMKAAAESESVWLTLSGIPTKQTRGDKF